VYVIDDVFVNLCRLASLSTRTDKSKTYLLISQTIADKVYYYGFIRCRCTKGASVCGRRLLRIWRHIRTIWRHFLLVSIYLVN